MSDFEVNDRAIEIKTDGRVQVSPVPGGVDAMMFRHLLAAIDLLYRLNSKFPSVAEIRSKWDFPTGFVESVITTPELKQALSIRGIETDPHNGLTSEQLYAITMLSDPTDRRTTDAKLRSAGISSAKHRAWMRDPRYSGAIAQQAEDNLADAVPVAINRLVTNAEAGDQRAIEKLLEITGRWNPQQQEVQNARTIVLTFMEVIQAEIQDKDQLRRIMESVQGKMTALTITQGLKEL